MGLKKQIHGCKSPHNCLLVYWCYLLIWLRFVVFGSSTNELQLGQFKSVEFLKALLWYNYLKWQVIQLVPIESTLQLDNCKSMKNHMEAAQL